MSMVGYYNELFFNHFLKTIESVIIVFTLSIDAHVIERLINFQVQFDYIEALFYYRKIHIYGVYLVSKETQQEIFSDSEKRICTTAISHVKSNQSNNFNASNSDNFMVSSNFPHSNVQNYSPFNTLINAQKVCPLG